MKLIKFVLVTTAFSSIIAASAAGAADLPPHPYKSLPPPPAYLWAGFYVGAHVGGGWLDIGNPFGNASGFVGGGQLGYNFQNGNWVWGAEAEVSGTTVGRTLGFASWNVDTVSTLTARGGYAFDRWLVYGKAGVGWVDVSANAVGFGAWGTTTGGAFGVGTEYALGNRWSAKVEYDVIDLGSNGFGNSATFQTFKAGVNYKFGGLGWPF